MDGYLATPTDRLSVRSVPRMSLAPYYALVCTVNLLILCVCEMLVNIHVVYHAIYTQLHRYAILCYNRYTCTMSPCPVGILCPDSRSANASLPVIVQEGPATSATDRPAYDSFSACQTHGAGPPL